MHARPRQDDDVYPEDPLQASEQMQTATAKLRSSVVPVIANEPDVDLPIDLG